MPIIHIQERLERIKFDGISDARLDHADGHERRYNARRSTLKYNRAYSKAYWSEMRRLTKEVMNG